MSDILSYKCPNCGSPLHYGAESQLFECEFCDSRFTLEQVKKNGVKPGIAGFVVPLCATIHLSGSAMKITACAVALMLMQGLELSTGQFVGFVMMLGVMMVAAPGVPGGAIMAALGVLQTVLGFTAEQQALMIALYITMDSFGTACNVTGDGAIALVVNTMQKEPETQMT